MREERGGSGEEKRDKRERREETEERKYLCAQFLIVFIGCKCKTE